jgi:hypothetical protein
MVWTRLKKLSEGLLAPTLRGRAAYHLARYGPGLSGNMVRGWVTLDGHEILSCSTIVQVRSGHALAGTWHSQDPAVAEALHRQGIFTRDEFVEALEMCVAEPVEALLQARQPLVRALAQFDRRVGKRRLRELRAASNEMPVVLNFHAIRREAERIAHGSSDLKDDTSPPGPGNSG